MSRRRSGRGRSPRSGGGPEWRLLIGRGTDCLLLLDDDDDGILLLLLGGGGVVPFC